MTFNQSAVFWVAILVLTGCSAETERLGTSDQALTDGDDYDDRGAYGYPGGYGNQGGYAGTGFSYDEYADECGPQAMMRQAPPDRQAILARAGRWVLSPVPYSQSDYVDGYRCDCSGFVSMAWDNGESFTTQSLPPNTSDTSIGYAIGWTEMLPGDALNNDHHMKLYAGLTRGGLMCIWEQLQSGTSTMSTAMTPESLSNYQPVRSSRFGQGSGYYW